MREAIKEAREAGERGDRPIGAVIVHKGRIVARGSNRVNSMQSDVYHAENMAIINSAPYLQKYGAECTIYTTVEPCIMCLGTIVLADISKVVFGMIDKYMKMDSYLKGDNYIKQKIELYLPGILEEECKEVLRLYASERDYQLIVEGHFQGIR